MEEMSCNSCGAVLASHTKLECEYCGSKIVLNAEQQNQFKQERRQFERMEKKKIEAHIQATFEFVPEKKQVGAIFFPKWLLWIAVGIWGILFINLAYRPDLLESHMGGMLLTFLFFFCPMLVIIFYAILSQRLKKKGISNFKTFWKFPKINPQLGLDIIQHAHIGTVSYETALRAMLAANIPLHVAINAFLLEGLEVSVVTVRFRLGRPI